MLARRVDDAREKELPLMLMLLPDSGFVRSHVYGAATKVIKLESQPLRETDKEKEGESERRDETEPKPKTITILELKSNS